MAAPGSDKYVGKCMGCNKRFTWPKTENTKGMIGKTAVSMTCPSCGGNMRQTNRNGSAPFHELHEHQAANAQKMHRQLAAHFNDRRAPKKPQGGEPGLTSL